MYTQNTRYATLPLFPGPSRPRGTYCHIGASLLGGICLPVRSASFSTSEYRRLLSLLNCALPQSPAPQNHMYLGSVRRNSTNGVRCSSGIPASSCVR